MFIYQAAGGDALVKEKLLLLTAWSKVDAWVPKVDGLDKSQQFSAKRRRFFTSAVNFWICWIIFGVTSCLGTPKANGSVPTLSTFGAPGCWQRCPRRREAARSPSSPPAGRDWVLDTHDWMLDTHTCQF